jgi:hypothetical protein
MFASGWYVMTNLDEFLENLGECLYIQRAATINHPLKQQEKKQRKAVRDTTKGSTGTILRS